MKRKIIKDLEKFSRNIEQKFEANDEMDPAGSVQIILKEQKNIDDRFRKFENHVEKFQIFLIDEWEESDDEEIEKMIEKTITEMTKYSDKIDVVIKRSYDIIDHMESSTQPAHDKFNLNKLNSGTNGTNVNTKISYNVDDDSAEEQDEIAQLSVLMLANVLDVLSASGLGETDAMVPVQINVTETSETVANVPDEEATSCRNCDFKVSGKVKPSKSRQKLKAHREKHHMAHVAVDIPVSDTVFDVVIASENLQVDDSHAYADTVQTASETNADTSLDVIPVFEQTAVDPGTGVDVLPVLDNRLGETDALVPATALVLEGSAGDTLVLLAEEAQVTPQFVLGGGELPSVPAGDGQHTVPGGEESEETVAEFAVDPGPGVDVLPVLGETDALVPATALVLEGSAGDTLVLLAEDAQVNPQFVPAGDGQHTGPGGEESEETMAEVLQISLDNISNGVTPQFGDLAPTIPTPSFSLLDETSTNIQHVASEITAVKELAEDWKNMGVLGSENICSDQHTGPGREESALVCLA